jgi:hypothetical protein
MRVFPQPILFDRASWFSAAYHDWMVGPSCQSYFAKTGPAKVTHPSPPLTVVRAGARRKERRKTTRKRGGSSTSVGAR